MNMKKWHGLSIDLYSTLTSLMNHHSSPLINSFQMDSWLANGLWSSLFLALAGNAGGLRSWSKSDRWWSKKLRLRLGLKIGYPNSWWFLIIVPMVIKWVINDDEWQAGGFKMVHISGLFRYLFDNCIQLLLYPFLIFEPVFMGTWRV